MGGRNVRVAVGNVKWHVLLKTMKYFLRVLNIGLWNEPEFPKHNYKRNQDINPTCLHYTKVCKNEK